MRRKLIIICCLVLCAIVGTGIYLHHTAADPDTIENVELGKSTASKYNGKKCSVRHGRHYCKCYGCASSNRDPYICRRCGHRCDKHTR